MENSSLKRKNLLFDTLKKELEFSGLVEVVASKNFHRGVGSVNCEGVICIQFAEGYDWDDVKSFLGRTPSLEEESNLELVYRATHIPQCDCGYDYVFVREVLPIH